MDYGHFSIPWAPDRVSNIKSHLPVHDEGADVGGDEGVHPGAGPGQVAGGGGQGAAHWAEHHARQVHDHNPEGKNLLYCEIHASSQDEIWTQQL